MARAVPTSFFLCIFLLAFRLPVAAASKPDVQVEVVARGLERPWAVAFAPDGRIFVTERPGRIRVIKNGALEKEPWMQIGAHENGEAGLLGLAVDPDFQRNHFLYAAYSYRYVIGGIKNRLVRLRDVAEAPDGAIYLLTSNRDSRGKPLSEDDRLLRLTVK